MRSVRALGALGLLGVALGLGPPAAADTSSGFRFVEPEMQAEEDEALVRVVVRRTSLPVGRATVDYRTEAGSATDGTDFHRTSGTLVFEVGASSATFAVVLRDDDVEEVARERLSVVLSDAGTTEVATITIVDDDAAAETTDSAGPLGSPASPPGGLAGPVAAASAPAAPAAGAGPVAPRGVASRPRPSSGSAARRVTVRQNPVTPFELRPAAPADETGAGSVGTAIDPLVAVMAGLLLARVAAEVWFRSRMAVT